jgi:hypothetical protein
MKRRTLTYAFRRLWVASTLILDAHENALDRLRRMNYKRAMGPSDKIEALIRSIRDQKVILDADLARIYGVPTKRLNEQVKRNRKRFPADFMFQLTRVEWLALRSQYALSESIPRNRSQIATGSAKHRDPRLLPYAFTENGAIMAANVLNSPQAVRMSVFVVRAFVKMREMLMGTQELAKQFKELEAQLKSRLDVHEVAIIDVLQRIMRLLDPPPEPETPKRQERLVPHT